MKTYVNTSLIEAHNAQMQLEQLEGVRLHRAGTLEVYGKFLLICAASLSLLLVGFGLMMWLIAPPPAQVGDQYTNSYDIAEMVIQRDAIKESSDLEAGATSPTISESLSEIQRNLSVSGEGGGFDSATVIDIEAVADESSHSSPLEVMDVEELSLPTDQFVVFRTSTVDEGVSEVVTGLTYRAENLSQPFQQYCYWTEAPKHNESTERYDLGNMTPQDGVVWYENEMVEAYKQFCQFLNS
jgi:hypothetical protein